MSDPARNRSVNRWGNACILAALLAIGAVLRLDFMRAVGFAIDGDEAIVGLMGKHILEGREVPTFYYGQHYMGSLEGLMASVSFALFGISPVSLQLVPLTWSLVLIVLMFFLTKSIMNPRAGLIAAALMAVAPPALLVWSSKARGGFIEVVAIGALALIAVVSWIRTSPDRLRYPMTIGVLLGLGWWVNNQIVYFIVPIGIFSVIHLFSRASRVAADGESGDVTTIEIARRVTCIVAVGSLAFLVGGAPWFVYHVSNSFPAAGMFVPVDWLTFREHYHGLTHVALPMIVGAQRFWQKAPMFPFAKHVAVCLYLLPIAALVLCRARALLGILVGSLDRKRPIELLTVFCLACCGIFAVSPFGGLVQAPRYLLPLYVGLFALVAICCEFVLRWNPRIGAVYVTALLSFQLLASYLGGRAVSGEPVVFAGERVARDHGPLIARLKELGITKIRTNYWIGYRLAFETKEEVTFTQIGEPFQIRIPEYEVRSSDERALLPLVLVRAQVPPVTAALKRMAISYREAQAGEYRVLYDLHRTIPVGKKLGLPVDALKVSASGLIDPKLALDGSLDTRWGTGAPQAPGQSYVVELPDGVSLSGIGYSFARWWPDRPREFRIEVEDTQGVRKVALTPFEAKGAFELSTGDGGFVVRFEDTEVKRVILSQLASDQVFDWSIAELELLGKSTE